MLRFAFDQTQNALIPRSIKALREPVGPRHWSEDNGGQWLDTPDPSPPSRACRHALPGNGQRAMVCSQTMRRGQHRREADPLTETSPIGRPLASATISRFVPLDASRQMLAFACRPTDCSNHLPVSGSSRPFARPIRRPRCALGPPFLPRRLEAVRRAFRCPRQWLSDQWRTTGSAAIIRASVSWHRSRQFQPDAGEDAHAAPARPAMVKGLGWPIDCGGVRAITRTNGVLPSLQINPLRLMWIIPLSTLPLSRFEGKPLAVARCPLPGRACLHAREGGNGSSTLGLARATSERTA